jgi:hypothetical protein
MYRQESLDAKHDASQSREKLESIINQQRTQIEKLQSQSQAANDEADSNVDAVRVLKQTSAFLISERCHLIHMLIDTVQTMQKLFYDPSPLIKPSSRPSSSVHRAHQQPQLTSRSALVVAGTVDLRREMADLRDVANQLEKEVAESATAYKHMLVRLNGEADRAERLVSTMTSSSSFEACKQLLCTGMTDSWSHEREVFHAAIKHMEQKFNQLMKIRSVLASRDDQLKMSSRPLWAGRSN